MIIRAGGIGTGGFVFDVEGKFSDWRTSPTEAALPGLSSGCGFYLWWKSRSGNGLLNLTESEGGKSALTHRFPITTRSYEFDAPFTLSAECYSPLYPPRGTEASFPLHVVNWNIHSVVSEPVEIATLLVFSSPEASERVAFDMQHDKLCLCGAVGDPDSQNRFGVSVPDLHGEGGWTQGIEPWSDPDGLQMLLDEFTEDGELGPANPVPGRNGAAAWVRFTLLPETSRDAPFCIAWSIPQYVAGPRTSEPRRYVSHLGKRRPDNAVVWLAERPFLIEEEGERAWFVWREEIRRWHKALESQPEKNIEKCLEELSGIVQPDLVWTWDNEIVVPMALPRETVEALRELAPSARIVQA
jgi:hypothetical protein